MTSILDTGKDGYSADNEFGRRTKAAVNGRPSEWGDADDLFHRDAVEVLDFIKGDYQVVAPILAKLTSYRILDLGCGYGRLAPLLAGLDCAQYQGIDSIDRRVEYSTERYGSGADRISFAIADVLALKPHPTWDVVWCSCVLQHFTIPDKVRLVETMKAGRTPGGICVLREEEIIWSDREYCEKRYLEPRHPKHMIPIPFDELAEAFKPLGLTHLPKVGGSRHRVYVAREGS